jgi:hypothetical protein
VSAGSPPPGEPVVSWEAPADDGLAVGSTIGAGWAMTRSHLVDLAAVAAIPVVAWNLVLVPVWAATAQILEVWVRFLSQIDWTRYVGDPDSVRREMQAIFAQSSQLVVLGTIGTGVGFVIAVVGAAAVTRATLDVAGGREVSVGRSFAAVADHAGAIVLPAVLLGAAYVAIGLPLSMSQSAVASAPTTTTRPFLALALTVLGWVVLIGAVYLAVRWAVVLQVILDESIGLRAGLARSAALTRGARVRIFLTMLAASLLVGLVLTIPASIVGIVGWLLTASITVGIASYTLVIILGSFVAVPLIVAILTVIYLRQREVVTSST